MAAFSAMLLAGCATAPKAVHSRAAEWRVIPLTCPINPDKSAILLNSKTGDTWVFSSGSSQWERVTRN